MKKQRSARFYLAVALLPFPSAVKVFFYRHLLGYSIGRGVHIGLSVIDAAACQIDEGVSIGHGNLVFAVERLAIGRGARIGTLNLIRGGKVSIGRHAEIIRLNELNAIPFPPEMNVDSVLSIGDWTSITAGHKIDFTGQVTFGTEVIVAGRNSSFWTHIRGVTLPIVIGDAVYIGSEVRMAPGASVPSGSVVGMGSVVVDSLTEHPGHVFAGVPARPKRPVSEKDAHLLFNRPPDRSPES